LRNDFKGICYRCGKTVEPRKGYVENVGDDHDKKWPELAKLPRFLKPKWLTQHVECSEKFKGTRQHHQYAPLDVP
jgi:hypothetical protein